MDGGGKTPPACRGRYRSDPPRRVVSTPATRHRFGARVLDWGPAVEVARELEATDSDPEGVGIMVRKSRIYPVRLEDVPLKAAPLLKQELLAVGGDAAHARGIADHSVGSSPTVLLASWAQYQHLLPKLRRQPFGLKEVADEVDRALRAFAGRGPAEFAGARRRLSLGARPRILGVVNVTPDSFSDGGRFLEPAAAVAEAERLVAEGADALDLGAESTRPGATPVSPEAEWARLAPVLSAVVARVSVPISVDTRHAWVAARAVDAGADIVNDVEGLRDEAMRRLVARTGAGAIAMHMRGTPTTMQAEPTYADVRREVFRSLADAVDRAVDDGVAAEQLAVDPGLGFGKTAEQSLELLAHVGELRSLGLPVVVGASRKSFLGWATGETEPRARVDAGVAAAVYAAEHGVAVIRTHDVGPTAKALRLWERIERARRQAPGTRKAAAPPSRSCRPPSAAGYRCANSTEFSRSRQRTSTVRNPLRRNARRWTSSGGSPWLGCWLWRRFRSAKSGRSSGSRSASLHQRFQPAHPLFGPLARRRTLRTFSASRESPCSSRPHGRRSPLRTTPPRRTR